MSGALFATERAVAIETASFGLSRVSGTRLEVPVRAGETTRSAVRVWNKTDGEITVDLRVQAATARSEDDVRLGGDPEPPTWVRLSAVSVVLAPQAQRDVTFQVD